MSAASLRLACASALATYGGAAISLIIVTTWLSSYLLYQQLLKDGSNSTSRQISRIIKVLNKHEHD
jgi:hypothetical protein